MMKLILIKLIKMNIKKWILVLYVTVLIGSICIDGLSTTTNERDGRKLFGGYRITPKFCKASKTLPRSDPRSHGPTICMFNHECTQREGEVVGACMDGFLFGACCQLHGEIDTPLVDEQSFDHPQSNLAAALSYESYGNQQTYQSNGNNYNEVKLQENSMKTVYRPSTNNKFGGVIKNNVYGSSIDDESNISSGNIQSNDLYSSHTQANGERYPINGFYVENDSVIVSSPSPEYSSAAAGYYPTTTTPATTAHDYYLPPSTGTSAQEHFSEELPTLIPTGPHGSQGAFTSEAFNQISESMFNSQSSEFTHSGITHPDVDSVIVEEGTYAEPVSIPYDEPLPESTERLSTTSASETVQTTFPQKVTYAKPAFKPKPNKNNPNKYVLVQTIDHEKPSKHGSISDNNIESIESIILMLNDTNTGPQYNTGSSTEPSDAESSYYDTTYGSSSTGAINVNQVKIDVPSYYVTSSTSRPPGPSFLSSSQTTNQPGQSTVHATSWVTKPHGSYYITSSTSKPPGLSDSIASSTPKPPSTSYVYSPVPTRLPINLQSTIGSSYGAVTPEGNGDYLSKPTPGNGYKKPVLITASSFATTKLPSTSYVTGAAPTKKPDTYFDDSIVVTATSHRPTTTVYKKPTKGKNPSTNKITTKNPSTSYLTGPTTPRPKNTTPKKPSTSYVYSTTQTKRPTTTTTKKGSKNKLTTISPVLIGSSYDDAVTTERVPVEYVVQSKPLGQEPSLGTDVPSPTVLITPKPTVNLITSSTWTQRPNLVTKYTEATKLPSTSYVYSPVVTYRPSVGPSTTPGFASSGYDSSTQSYLSSPSADGISGSGVSGPGFSSPPHRVPISNDFYDSGYHGQSSTHRPNIYQTYTTSSGYGVYENDDYNSIPGSSTSYPGFLGATQSYGPNGKHPTEYSTLHDEFYTSPNDVNNFPPVRNPNLNVSATFGTGVTVDDYDISTPDFVDDQSLNDKMGLLVSKIVESLQGNFDELADVVYQDKNSTVLSDSGKPSGTKRPSATTKKPLQKATTTKRPASNTRPGTTNARPGATSTKQPVTRVTTKRPTVASQTNTRRTTKKPTTITTKKPVVTRITTTRRPTTKPTKKIIQTTTVQQDEDNDVEEEGEEESNDEEEETTTFGEGRIQCGVRPQFKSGRIVGGKGATLGKYPWQVLLREATWLGLFTKNKCGGVLISKNYVMTAAHCQPGFLASLVAVFGEFDISSDLEAKRSVTKNVKRVIVHREYDPATFENDLALLELESPIHYDTHIVPICMPPNTADFTGRMATVTGWGRLKYGGGVPSVLQEVQVPVIENSVCQEMFHTAGHNKKILPSFLCAGYANGQKDSCEGDSGGPLVLQRSDGRWELAGTVSHGIKCAAPYLPGVYMRTTYYKPWLESITGVH